MVWLNKTKIETVHCGLYLDANIPYIPSLQTLRPFSIDENRTTTNEEDDGFWLNFGFC
jgi:hypothetical protein